MLEYYYYTDWFVYVIRYRPQFIGALANMRLYEDIDYISNNLGLTTEEFLDACSCFPSFELVTTTAIDGANTHRVFFTQREDIEGAITALNILKK